MNLLKLFSPNILLSHNHNTIMAAAVAEKFSSHPIPKQTIGAPIYSSAEKIAVKIGPANLRNDDDKFTSLERSSPAFSSHPLWHTLENRSPP